LSFVGVLLPSNSAILFAQASALGDDIISFH
jgi:hypothetical protein